MKNLLKFAVLAGLVAAAAKAMKRKKADWDGLTEADARTKVASKLPTRIPDEKREAVTDQIVSKMKDQGMIREPADSVTPAEASDEAADHDTDQQAEGNGSGHQAEPSSEESPSESEAAT